MNISPRALTLVTVVAVVAIFAIILVNRGQAPAAAQLQTTDVDFQIERQPVLGDPDAPVTIVSFEDYRCPSCRSFEETVKPQIVSEFIETGQANLVSINFPVLGPESVTAAVAAECVYAQDPAQFWDYKAAVYRVQGPQNQSWATPARLVEVAHESAPDIDHEQLSQCIENRDTEQEVDADRQIARQAGVSGTPTVFVDNQRLPNWQIATVRSAVEAAAQAR